MAVLVWMRAYAGERLARGRRCVQNWRANGWDQRLRLQEAAVCEQFEAVQSLGEKYAVLRKSHHTLQRRAEWNLEMLRKASAVRDSLLCLGHNSLAAR